MTPLPPGTILQLIFLKERLKKIKPGRFIEIGPGGGEISNLLLELGWKGESYDLELRTVKHLRNRFTEQILKGRYLAKNEDFFQIKTSKIGKFDLVISCMVMEHLCDELESKFMENSAQLLTENGFMIGFIPASPDHWGIEDDIAGHYRRYTRKSLFKMADKNGWKVSHCSGLTYPISNILLPISNFLVYRAEKAKMILSNMEKTKLSGIRDVQFKTKFPNALSLILNKYLLFPFHLIQKAFANSRNSLVLYFEASPPQYCDRKRLY